VNASRRGGDGSTATITSLASLLSTPTSELLRPQASILCLDPGSTVGEALAALAARRVLSAPVRTLESAAAAAGSSPSNKKIPEGTTKEFEEASEKATAEGRDFVCFVDVRDVLMSFLEVIPRGSLDGAKLLKRAKVLEEAGSRLSEMPLSSLPVIGSDGAFLLDDEEREDDNDDDDDEDNDDGKTSASASASAAAAALSSSMPLRSLLSGFLVGGGGGAVSAVRQGEFPRARAVAHRVALLSPKKKKRKKKVGEETSGESVPEERQRVTHIVSQLDVARFVIKNAAVLGPLALKTAAELGELLFFEKISLFLFFFLSFFFFVFFFFSLQTFLTPLSLFPLFSLFSLLLSQAGPRARSSPCPRRRPR
jgi:hypothetical protein